ncbi:hypothetical protein CV103_09385 [Sphingomonas fennica]|uniref:Uncharacterized protein n=1 Tax=Edaphosphingomonas fennica TaxID=114404 RepID=A0A2T4HZQ6_9SPHN|nr:hypothetical protein CV103_09385 [Sphingomonas fennica]
MHVIGIYEAEAGLIRSYGVQNIRSMQHSVRHRGFHDQIPIGQQVRMIEPHNLADFILRWAVKA